MKFSHERRLTQCLNCLRVLKKTDNYCPECGQENADHKVSIGLFLKDFLSNYLAVDSSLGRTVVPFLFKPGKLTTTFNQGRRKKYIHPIRLYLILSLFYFFIIGYIIPYDLLDRVTEINTSATDDEKNSVELSESFPKKDREKIDSLVKNNPELNFSVQDSSKRKGTSLNTESIRGEWKKIKLAAVDNDLSQEEFNQVVDSTGFGATQHFKTVRGRKFLANINVFIMKVAKNLPLMMFLLLPIFAFLLWLLHLSSRTFYIENLVHALHLHSFAYLLYGIGIILISIMTDYGGELGFSIFLLVSIYAFISIKRVYRNSFIKTIVKFNLLGFSYFAFLLMAVLLEIYLSYLSL